MTPKATIGRIVIYRTDGRNGLVYDLPAMITCTQETHPGDYPDGAHNPLPVPESETHVHLTVFTPGGFGSYVTEDQSGAEDSAQFVGASSFTPGSGSYVEWSVPFQSAESEPEPRTWRWPVINK